MQTGSCICCRLGHFCVLVIQRSFSQVWAGKLDLETRTLKTPTLQQHTFKINNPFSTFICILGGVLMQCNLIVTGLFYRRVSVLDRLWFLGKQRIAPRYIRYLVSKLFIAIASVMFVSVSLTQIKDTHARCVWSTKTCMCVFCVVCGN